jgi:cell division protein FtsN
VFITAYKDGKRLALSKTSATVEKNFKEDLNEPKAFSSIDKKLVIFKVQLGSLKKPSQEKISDDLFKEIQNLEKQTTASGSIRYSVGSFESFTAAESFRKELEEKGFSDAFIIATFKNEIISIQEANDLLK